MNVSDRIKAVKNREDRIMYKGLYKDFQTFGESAKKTKCSQPLTKSYTEEQNFLYKRVMFGLTVYGPEELKTLHWQKRKRIIKVHKKTHLETTKINKIY